MHKSIRGVIVGLLVSGLLASTACAKVPETAKQVEEIPLPSEIDEIDSSKLVATDLKANCRNAPSIATAAKHSEYDLVGGGVYGTYDWAAGKTNGGQIWKTRLAYSKANLAQIRISPTYPQIGNVATQSKLAKKINAVAYVNGDFFQLRGSNLLYSAMIHNNEFVYSPVASTSVVGVVEEKANDRTGLQGASYLKVNGKKKIATQGLNLRYLASDAVGAYNSLKTTIGFPKVSYVVEVTGGVVSKVGAKETFNTPSEDGDYVFVAVGVGVERLKTIKVGDKIEYTKPKNAKTTKFLRTQIAPAGTVTFPDGEVVEIRAVNHRNARISYGAVLFTNELYPTTSKLSATVVTNLQGVIVAVYPDGKAINVKGDQLVLQFGSKSVAQVKALKVGNKLRIVNDYKIKKDLKLFSAFGNRQNLMINSVIVARCSPAMEDIRPRNAMGWNENGDVWFATTTMGVRNSADVFNRFRLGGSTVHQLTSWLKELGATQAIMLDGGGSTTMYAQTPEADYKRVDLPATEWVRTVPQGIGMVVR